MPCDGWWIPVGTPGEEQHFTLGSCTMSGIGNTGDRGDNRKPRNKERNIIQTGAASLPDVIRSRQMRRSLGWTDPERRTIVTRKNSNFEQKKNMSNPSVLLQLLGWHVLTAWDVASRQPPKEDHQIKDTLCGQCEQKNSPQERRFSWEEEIKSDL